jgi:hypothetical protein
MRPTGGTSSAASRKRARLSDPGLERRRVRARPNSGSLRFSERRPPRRWRRCRWRGERSGLPPRRSGRSLRSCRVGGRWSLEPARGGFELASEAFDVDAVYLEEARSWFAHQTANCRRFSAVRLTGGASVARHEPGERKSLAIGEALIDRHQNGRDARIHHGPPVRDGGPEAGATVPQPIH